MEFGDIVPLLGNLDNIDFKKVGLQLLGEVVLPQLAGNQTAPDEVVNTPYRVLSSKDQVLLHLRDKIDGGVIINIGTRFMGKSELSLREAEFLAQPTYGVCPEQCPPPWVKRITLKQLWDVPPKSTVIIDDLPTQASNRDYLNVLVQELEKLVPMVRHERKLKLIFNTQSGIQADKYVLDCDALFLKPLGILVEDRPKIAKIYKEEVDPYFAGKSIDFCQRHAYMISNHPPFRGGIMIARASREGKSWVEGTANPQNRNSTTKPVEEVDPEMNPTDLNPQDDPVEVEGIVTNPEL